MDLLLVVNVFDRTYQFFYVFGIIAAFITVLFILRVVIQKSSSMNLSKLFLDYLNDSKFIILGTVVLLLIVYAISFKLNQHESMLPNIVSIFITVCIIDFILATDKNIKNRALIEQAVVQTNKLKTDIACLISKMFDNKIEDSSFTTEIIGNFLEKEDNVSKKIEQAIVDDGLLSISKVYRVNLLHNNYKDYILKINGLILSYSPYMTVKDLEELNELLNILNRKIFCVDFYVNYQNLENEFEKKKTLISIFSNAIVEIIKICEVKDNV